MRARIEGQIWHLEIKKEVGVVSKDQMRVLAALKERRANARILWGGEGCLDFLHEIEQAYEVNG